MKQNILVIISEMYSPLFYSPSLVNKLEFQYIKFGRLLCLHLLVIRSVTSFDITPTVKINKISK